MPRGGGKKATKGARKTGKNAKGTRRKGSRGCCTSRSERPKAQRKKEGAAYRGTSVEERRSYWTMKAGAKKVRHAARRERRKGAAAALRESFSQSRQK